MMWNRNIHIWHPYYMSIKGMCLIYHLTLVTHSHWPQRPKLIWNAQHHHYFTHAHHSIIEETSKWCNTAICITLRSFTLLASGLIWLHTYSIIVQMMQYSKFSLINGHALHSCCPQTMHHYRHFTHVHRSITGETSQQFLSYLLWCNYTHIHCSPHLPHPSRTLWSHSYTLY